jgi:MoaA/NifB/PqqE/SkfB family radical SAM enzyme
MHCVGCWSGTYGKKNNLSFEDMDKIVSEGKELGTYLYFMTGGEPMVRWNDIKKLAEKHNDCEFAMFSNSTLITEDVCKDVVRLGNITYMLSIEGTPDTNDARRGVRTLRCGYECHGSLLRNTASYFRDLHLLY